MDEPDEQIAAAVQLAKEICPFLYGKGPNVQSVVLLELCSMFICGHHPDIRQASLEHFIKALREVVEIDANAPFAHPGGARQ